MGRPRNDTIPSERRHCNAEGTETEHRRHRAGRTEAGEQKYRWVCVPCHSDRNLTAYHNRPKTGD